MKTAIETVANIYSPGVGWGYKNITLTISEDYRIRIEDEEGTVMEFDSSAIDELHEDDSLYDEDTATGELDWDVE